MEAERGKGLTIDERQEILQKEIISYVARGFHVESQTELSVYLVRPKQFNWVWLVISILSVGLGLLFYLIKGDNRVYLEVLPSGRIKRSPTIDYGQSMWCPVPEKRVEVLEILEKRAQEVYVHNSRLDRYGINQLLDCADDRVWKCRYPGQDKSYFFPESRLCPPEKLRDWEATIKWQCQKCGHIWSGKSLEERTVRAWCRVCGSRDVYPGTKDLTWSEVAHLIRVRDHFKCQICGARASILQVHHIIPIYRGGSNHPSNLVTLCQKCHRKRHWLVFG